MTDPTPPHGGSGGTIKTPFGPAKKQTVLLIGAGTLVLVAIIWYRSRNAPQDTAAPQTTDPNSDPNSGYDTTSNIDPQTGYPYGTSEDQAALASEGITTTNIDPQTGYAYGSAQDLAALQQLNAGGTDSGTTPTGPSGISSPGPSGGGAPGRAATNEQWQAEVLRVLGNKAGPAIRLYLDGSGVTSAQRAIVEQAIALAGQPPQSGANGYPPGIRDSSTAPVPHNRRTHEVTADGKQTLSAIARDHGNSYADAKKLNPWASRFTVKGRPIPKGYKVKLYE